MYISDVAEVLSTLIYKEQLGIINIGTGNGFNISSIAQKIVDQIGHKNLVRYSASTQPASVVVSNPNKLLSIIGKYSWTSIDKAISETVKARIKQ